MLSSVGTKLFRSAVGKCRVSDSHAGRRWREKRAESHCDDLERGEEGEVDGGLERLGRLWIPRSLGVFGPSCLEVFLLFLSDTVGAQCTESQNKI